MTQGVYQIKVKGRLDSSRSEWFEGWTITSEEDGTTVLTGRVADQSALHGMLIKIHNLNLPLLSVNCVEPDQEDGLTIMNEPQYIWRMPTVDEIVRSLVRHGENAGCTWDGKSERAICQVLPDKETPLWAPNWSPIYYWAADEYDEHEAYYVSYNGKGINYQPKSWGNQRHGYRFVREP